MLQLADSLTNIPIMSLRTGGGVAWAERPIINPNNLKIEGWYCRDQFSKKELVLLSKDIRDIVPQGFAIDDYDVLSEPDELVRLKDILGMDFELIGKPVITDSKRKVGKVSDYATDTASFFVHKLYISQPVYKTLSGGQLSIDRTQIVEISTQRIIVRDTEDKVRSPATALIGVR
jgi:sporulation protein YlmC with PRC-barrel domain